MAKAIAKIIIAGQKAAVFHDGTVITIEINGSGIKRMLDAFSVQLARIGLTPIEWRAATPLEMPNEQQQD